MADQESEQDPANAMEPPKAVQIGGESIVDRLLPHIKKILVTFIVAAVLITVILMIRWRKHVNQEDETTRIAKVLDVGRTEVGEPPPALPDTPAPTGPRFKDAKERADKALAAMQAAGTTVTTTYRAGLLLDAGKVDDAIAEYRKATGSKGLEGVLAREGLGIALEAKASAEKDATARQKLLEESLAAFGTMQPEDKGLRRAYMHYHQGRIQALLGKKSEAKASFEKAKELGDSIELSSLIESRLAAL